VQQAFSNSFQGSSATSNFGSCGGNTPTPPPDNGGGDDAAICGNGVVEDGEDCDDGNNNDRDACTNQCTNARCGDGIVQNGVEQCDDGNNNNLDSCTNTCTNARCGDGFVQAGEECDDGNLVNNDDSCKNNCMLPACGDGIQQSGEECDDGNDNNNDSCTDQCKSASCGDGFVQSGEECDDANTRNGDGCSSSCEVEGGGSITPSCPSGEAQVELVLNTDLYAFTENELYFYDEAAPDEDFIWIATTRGILSNHRYELSECVQTSKCYKFYFFDTYGDGLFDGGLTVKYNGQSVLDVKPYELGEKWEDGTATVYWRRTLGNCSD
jgi:cysteine-rich repeat protein